MSKRRPTRGVDQVGRHSAFVPLDPDARLHRINQEYGDGFLAGLWGEPDGRNAHHYPEYWQGVRDGQVAAVVYGE